MLRGHLARRLFPWYPAPDVVMYFAFLAWLLSGVLPIHLTGFAQESSASIDTGRGLAEARAAQRAFEARRRHLLPYGASGGGRCDERIGRFCYWYNEGDTSLPAEPPSVREARAKFLAELAAFHRRLPQSEWLLGQRVRYLVEHGDLVPALELTDSCSPSSWWCDALAGFVRHAAERFAAADSAYARALAVMPTDIRCEWTDWRPVLDSELYRRMNALECSTRGALTDSVFWLATPLLARPGNDLRTELFSRRVMDWLLRESRSPQAMAWGRDVSELLLRYGWPIRWSLAERSPASLEAATVVGHEPSPAFTFFPIPASDRTQPWRFVLKRDRPRSRYAPTYTKHFTAVERYQIARFPRGDSTLLVLSMDLDEDTAFAGRPMTITAAASAGPGSDPMVSRQPLDDRGRVFFLTTPTAPVLVSLEARASDPPRFARARTLLDPLPAPSGFLASDLLLFQVGESLPTSLYEAARQALPAPRWPRAEPVGVYWELAGAIAESLDVAVSVVPARRGFLGRLGQSLSLVGRRAPLTLQWTLPGGDAVLGRAFELNLARLRPGSYRLLLTVTSNDGMERTLERTIELLK